MSIWNSFDLAPLKTREVELTLHNRLRTRQASFQQGRTGAVLIGGYCQGREEDTREERQTSHRPFGGVEALVYWRGDVSVAYRGLVEGFIPGGARPLSSASGVGLAFPPATALGLSPQTACNPGRLVLPHFRRGIFRLRSPVQMIESLGILPYSGINPG